LIFMGGWTGYAIRQGAGLAIPLGFLTFSRGFESEADFLGLQYMYKAGYDPTAFVDFFEKIQSKEKKKPGTMSKVFSTHPMTDDRIKTSQKTIQDILKAKPEYVVTTSEFNDVKTRLYAMHNRRKPDDKDLSRPRLRRAPGGGTIPADEHGDDQLFVRSQRQNGHRRLGRGDQTVTPAVFILLPVEAHAEEFQACATGCSQRGGVLADAPRESDGVKPVQGRGISTDRLLHLV